MRVTVTGNGHWPVQGVASVLQRHGMQVTRCEPQQLGAHDVDVVVAVGLGNAAAAAAEQALALAVPVLWLGSLVRRRTRRTSGWLAAEVEDQQLIAAVQALAVGLWVDDGPEQPVTAVSPDTTREPLTPRELEVFELLAKGLNNRDIAAALGISTHTAKFHVAQILEKTAAASRTEAVRQGLRLGWIGL